MNKKLVRKSYLLTLLLVVSYSQHSISREIETINIPESIELANDTLVLNGAGVRTKFFFSIYIGSLYLKSKLTDTDLILKDKQAKQINLHFLYKEVSQEKLVNGWIDGFKNNNNETIYNSLKTRLDKFNSCFKTMFKGDTVQLEFLTTNNTRVLINNKLKAEIPGADFQIALLNVWLGDDPADYNLKEAILGITED